MSNDCAMDDTEALHPASGSLPKGGPRPHVRSRLRLPCTARTIRVRSLALWVSLSLHAAFFAMLCASRLDAPPQEAPPLINIEFVEIPGPKGGGGTPALAAGDKALVPAPQVVAVPDPAARQAPAPDPAQPAVATSASANASGVGSSGGSGGGGQGTGAGTATGAGTGQGGIAVDRMPVPVRTVKPRYPLSARRMGQNGQVLLRIHVDQDGAVREVTVVQAEPPGVFESAAIDAVRKWHFTPALSHGTAVSMWMTLPVRFALDER